MTKAAGKALLPILVDPRMIVPLVRQEQDRNAASNLAFTEVLKCPEVISILFIRANVE